MAYNAQRRPTVCAAEEPFLHATRDIVRPCVLSKGDDGMPDPMSFVSVFCQMVKIACTPNVVRPSVLS